MCATYAIPILGSYLISKIVGYFKDSNKTDYIDLFIRKYNDKYDSINKDYDQNFLTYLKIRNHYHAEK